MGPVGELSVKRPAVQILKEPAPGNFDTSKGVFLEAQTFFVNAGVTVFKVITYESQKVSQLIRSTTVLTDRRV